MSKSARELFTKERSDLSNFLIHLTKNGSFDLYEPFAKVPGHYLFRDSQGQEADDALKEILKMNPPTLLARSPFSHFKYGISVGYQSRRRIPLEWLQCVCFSEAPLRELKSFYRATQDPKNQNVKANKYQKYGLAFHTEFVRSKNGHPLFYFDSRRKAVVTAVDMLGDPPFRDSAKNTLALYESYGPKLHSKIPNDKTEVDFRWEREWRVLGSLQFRHDEVAFGLCPENEIEKVFQPMVGKAFPFIDPDWDIDSLKIYLNKSGWNNLADAI